MFAQLMCIGLAVLIAAPATAKVWSRAFTLPPTGYLSGIAGDHGRVFVSHERLGGPCVVRLSADGANVTESCYGPANEINGGRVAVVADGFFAYGSSFPLQQAPEAAYVFRVDSAGKLLWSRRYLASARMRITSGAPAPDGGLVIAGSLGRVEATQFVEGEKALIFKVDRNGKLQWARTFDSAGVDEFRDIRVSTDGISAAGHAGFGAFVVKLRLSGEPEWTARFAGPRIEAITRIGGDLVVAGATHRGDYVVDWICRLDQHGRIKWERFANLGSGEINRVTGLAGDEIAGYGEHASGTRLIPVVFRFKGSGELVSARSLFLPSAGRPPAVALTAGGPLIVTALAGGAEVYKIDVDGTAPACLQSGAIPKLTFDLRTSVAVDNPIDEERPMILEKDQAGAQTFASVALRDSCQRKASPEETVAAEGAADEQDAEYRAFCERLEQLLSNRKFQELDRLAKELRENGGEFANGGKKYADFYILLSDSTAFGTEKQHIALVEEWRRQNPQSVAAAIVTARTYHEYAWAVRGGTVASGVSESAWKRFEELSGKAEEALADAGRVAAGDPEYDVSLVIIFGSDCERLRRIAYDPAIRDRHYARFFRAASNYFLPRWCGTGDEYRKFAEYAAESVGPDGNILYAQIALRALMIEENAPIGEKVPFFGTYKFDWPRMRQGLVELIAKHPKDVVFRNQLVYAAWKTGDRQTAKTELEQAPLPWSQRLGGWQSAAELEQARAWALKPPEQGFVDDKSVRLKAPAAGASGWIASAGKQWPPIILRSTLRLRDGSQFRDFNAFLVDTPEGVVAITAISRLDVNRGSQVVPYRIDELRTKLDSWTMVSPDDAAKVLTVGSIEPGSALLNYRGVVLTVSGAGSKLPVQVLKPRTSPAPSNSRVYIIGCVPASGTCKQTIYSGQLHGRITSRNEYGSVATVFDDDLDWRDFVGSPVVDEDGFVIGVISTEMMRIPGNEPKNNRAMAEEIQVLLAGAK